LGTTHEQAYNEDRHKESRGTYTSGLHRSDFVEIAQPTNRKKTTQHECNGRDELENFGHKGQIVSYYNLKGGLVVNELIKSVDQVNNDED
jgi:hypothetical protein